MKILLAQNIFYYAYGGESIANRIWLEELSKKNHECRAIARSTGKYGQKTRSQFIDGLTEKGIDVASFSMGTVRFSDKGVKVSAISELPVLKQELIDQIHEFTPDLILVSSCDPGFILLKTAMKMYPEKVVYILHTPEMLPFGPDSFSADFEAGDLLKKVRGTIAITRDTARYFRQISGKEAVTIHPPIYGSGSFNDYGCFDEGYITLINPSAIKGISIFLALARNMPNYMFAAVPTWATTDNDLKALEKLSNVKILQPNDNINEILSKTRILLVPSLWREGFGFVAVEAMLRGIPVLASDQGGLKEAKMGVDYTLPVCPITQYKKRLNDRGLFVPVVPDQNIAPWADAIHKLLLDKEHYDTISRNSRQVALKYVSEIRLEAFEDFLIKIASSSPVNIKTGGVKAKESVHPPEKMSTIRNLSPEKRALLLLRTREKGENYFLKFTDGYNAKNAMLTKEQNALFQSYMDGALYVNGFPKCLHIELTNACNLECIMCPRKNMTRGVGFMDFELFKKIIDECSGNVDFICLNFMGEPFLHKKVFDFIAYASKKGMTLNLSTNATLLDTESIDRLLKSELDILVLSIDSLNENTYKNIRVNSDFNKVMGNVEELLYKHKITKSHLNICCQIINMNRNADEISAFKKQWKPRSGLNILVKAMDDFGGQLEDVEKLGVIEHLAGRQIICPDLWSMLLVGWDGNVLPCHYDYDYKYILGNANDSSLREIWNSERMQTLRKLHRESKRHTVALCKNCFYFNSTMPGQTNHLPLHIRFNPSLQLTQFYSCKGNYGFEPHDFQTMLTQKEFEFPVQDKFRDVRFVFCNENPDHETLQMKVKLFQNVIGMFNISGETEIFLKTPDQFKGRLLRYEFSVNHDWTPKEKGRGYDTRKIGVRIKNIIT